MTKSQSNKAFKTASDQQAQSSQNAQSSYNAATGDIGDYKTALAKYSAENPFVQGGQFQTSANQQMNDTAAAGSTATQQAITGSMVRSGLNPTAAIAAGKQIAQENARTQMDEEARANQARIAGLAGYNANTLNASAKPEEMEADLMKGQISGEQGALGSETETAKTPSFWQQMGQSALNAGVAYAGHACWIAARAFGGWENPRTILVRHWLFLEFGRGFIGDKVVLLYLRYGERIANQIMPRSRLADRFFTWLAHQALERAEVWLATVPGRRAAGATLAEVL